MIKLVATDIDGTILNWDGEFSQNVINCINVGVIVSYNNGAYIGAYIGSIGFGDINTKASVNVLIDGCKQVGEVYYVFDSSISSAGNIVGGTHRELNSSISIIVTDKTYSILNVDLIRNNNTVTGINLESNNK